jgi:hypothetical protein
MTYADTELHKKALALKADIYIMALGLNDLKMDLKTKGPKWISRCKEEYEKLFNSFKNLPNKPTMYITTPQHWTDHYRIERVPTPYQITIKETNDKGLDKQYNKLVPSHMRQIQSDLKLDDSHFIDINSMFR